MTRHSTPTESTDPINVIVLEESGGKERIDCHSYSSAIDKTREELGSDTVVKIEDRDGDIVFSSYDMSIDGWEKEWKRAKKRESVTVEEHDCPYDNVGCFKDDLCVQCEIDKVQSGY